MTEASDIRLRILLIGREGQVGWELARALAPVGEVTATSRAELDLTSDTSIRSAVQTVRPHLIVNAAAYTAVDKAESEPELARRINADAVVSLTAEAHAIGAAMIHYSTDYVFDGSKTEPYVEEDSPNPLGVYGKTKLAGEQALISANVPYIIFRVSWVYGSRGKNFLNTILRLAGERTELRIVDDQFGAPTSAKEIARGTRDIIHRLRNQGQVEKCALAQVMAQRHGIYHMAAAGQATWYGFAQAIIKRAGIEGVKVHPIATSEYPTPAGRPRNSRLNCAKLATTLKVRLADWRASLNDVMADQE